MKIVVYEHFTSGALQDQALPAELAHEGDAMLQAIVSDMLANTPFQPIVLRDNRLVDLAGAQNVSIANKAQYHQFWQLCLDDESLFLLIAPETNGVLRQLAETVVISGKKLLGASPEVIAICSDKLLCSQFLQRHGLPIVETQNAKDWLNHPAFTGSAVIKPNDGAGCVDTFYFANQNLAIAYLQKLPADKLDQQIVQPFINAQAMSLSLFIGGSVQILSLNQQLIDIDQQFSYQGSNIAVAYLDAFSLAQAQLLVDQLQQIMPGLSGFIGIDILVNEHQILIVDINPRLTSSFNQLQQIGLSPASLLYQSLTHDEQGVVCG